jgi:hypothetical protein
VLRKKVTILVATALMLAMMLASAGVASATPGGEHGRGAEHTFLIDQAQFGIANASPTTLAAAGAAALASKPIRRVEAHGPGRSSSGPDVTIFDATWGCFRTIVLPHSERPATPQLRPLFYRIIPLDTDAALRWSWPDRTGAERTFAAA